MLKPLQTDDARRLLDTFREAGYSATELLERLGTVVPPAPRNPRTATFVEWTEDPTPFNALVRWFFLGLPVSAGPTENTLPRAVVEKLMACGLLKSKGKNLVPQALVVPCERFWIAADLHQHRDTEQGVAEHVLAVNDPALNLARIAIRSPVSSTLDLCSGSAIHALLAADFSEQVVASDLSPRAATYARFNASLNGVENLECVTGPLFDRLSGRRFERILCNPPFFISPDLGMHYRDNNLDLDEFCRRLVGRVPDFLVEGGICQLICEWVEVQGQGWQARLSEWFEGSGCDIWVLQANLQLGDTYAQERSLATDAVGDTRADELLENWLRYFRDHQVQRVLGGFILMRRRKGENWIRFEELREPLTRPIGEAVERGFADRDFLASRGTDRLLACSPQVTPGLRLERHQRWSGEEWVPESTVLRVVDGLPAAVGIDDTIRRLLESFDGRSSVSEVLDRFARDAAADPAVVKAEGLRLVEMLITHGCVLV